MRSCLFLLLSLCLFSCYRGKQPKRFASVTGLKKEKLATYRALHAAVWPEVLAKIKDCNISNYSIYLKEIDSSYYLFSYMEYTGQDFKADMEKMAADSLTRAWWKVTDPCQSPLPEAEAQGKIWAEAAEVFHTD